MVQIVMMLYLFYIPFYSRMNSCWNSCGIYMHAAASIMVFLLLPITCIVLGALDIADIGFESEHAAIHFTIAVCQVGSIMVGVFIVRKIAVRSWQWHSMFNSKNSV